MARERTDLGDGHSFTFFVGDPEHFPTNDGRLLRWDGEDETLCGIIEWHPRPDGRSTDHEEGLCGGAVNFVQGTNEAGRPIWQVHSLDPLHIEPSVLCVADKGGCGSHGSSRDGRWVEA